MVVGFHSLVEVVVVLGSGDQVEVDEGFSSTAAAEVVASFWTGAADDDVAGAADEVVAAADVVVAAADEVVAAADEVVAAADEVLAAADEPERAFFAAAVSVSLAKRHDTVSANDTPCQ